jgi:hypothetical protein
MLGVRISLFRLEHSVALGVENANGNQISHRHLPDDNSECGEEPNVFKRTHRLDSA